jgi:hypothetical protein
MSKQILIFHKNLPLGTILVMALPPDSLVLRFGPYYCVRGYDLEDSPKRIVKLPEKKGTLHQIKTLQINF